MEVKGGRLRVLTSDDVYEIHLASLEILGRVGVRVLEPKAFSVLKEAGAEVNHKERIARIPKYLVKEAVKKAPNSFTLYGRNGNYKLQLGDKKTYFALPGTGVNVLDLETGKCRSSTLADVKNFYKLADALPNIHHASLAVEPTDISNPVASLYSILEGFRNTTKTIDGDSYGEIGSLDTIKMASIVADGIDELRKKPRLLGYVNPVSPLQQSREMMEGLLIYAKYSQPVIIAPEAQAGATAPVTLAGLLAQQNAEILSGVVISQLVNPGSPVLYGAVSTIMDMIEGNVALGSVETGLINVAAAQLARFYNLPSRGTGGTTEAKVPDLQAGYEKAVTLMMASLAGINFIYDAAGSLESRLTASFEQVVADNELCGMVARAARGIDVCEETLAIDIIEAVGPGGHYLTQKHTLEHLRKEHYLPSILNRQNRLKWEKNGSKTLRDVAREETKRILKEHEPEPLEPEVDKELEKTIKELEKKRM